MANKFITEQDIRFAVAIVAFLVPIFLCYADLTKQLALIQQSLLTIKSNDLAHIEIQLADFKIRNSEQDARTIGLEKDVSRIIATLESEKEQNLEDKK